MLTVLHVFAHRLFACHPTLTKDVKRKRKAKEDQPLPTMTITAAQLLYGAQVLLADKDGNIEGLAAIEQVSPVQLLGEWRPP